MPSLAPHARSLAELEQTLRAVEPGLRLVLPRILRRVIKLDRGLPGIGVRVPHRKSYVISRDRLLRLAEPDELSLEPGDELPATVVLAEWPRPEPLAGSTADLLARYWRALYHSRIHCVLEKQLSDADASARLRALGTAEVAEARSVLEQERYLLAGDDRSLYIELAAVYLELAYFNPVLLRFYFPGLDAERAREIFALDLDADAVLAATRPAGAADLPKPVNDADEAAEEPAAEEPVLVSPAPGQYQRLMHAADAAAERGNLVRAAVLRTRAAAGTTAGYAARAQNAAAADLNRLARRLQRALGLKAEETRPLRRALPALLEPAARGTWSVAARFLYDLQKVCGDHERAVYQIDVFSWLTSLGRKPLRRPLPGQEEVLALKHLRAALRHLAGARLADADRRRLATVLHRAVGQEEARLRARFRPMVRDALEEVALRPQNLPERVARDKLTEELLDRVIEHGYLTMGDLRDALSRNQLKLPDLHGPAEWLGGDPLIQANRRLADRLAGTYRGGEVYLRWLQRLSAAAFGTRVGRFLTLYLALPFGSAFVALKGLEEIAHLGLEILPGEHAGEVRLLNVFSLVSVGLFLFLLLHAPPFRRMTGCLLAATYHGGRRLLVDLPLRLARLPLVRRVVSSAPFRAACQFVLKPLAVAAPLSLVLPALGAGSQTWASGGAALFLAATGVINSRLGRDLEEIAADWLAHRWERLRLDIVPGLLRWVIAVFRRAVEAVERVLYTVDEWLRFRAGDSQMSFVGKLVLGLAWSVVTYLLRVFINLFVEPTFNPIKHFPVVTVAAKLIVPVIPTLASGITLALKPVLGLALAGLTAGLVIFFIPGLAGFLVWELKENWRLYRANRPRNLRPVLIGHHGETLPRLLRPGFHSGTLPKLYARLRKSRRRAQRTGRWGAFFRQRVALDHAEEALRHFVEREFLNLLQAGGCPELTGASVEEIALSTNRVRVALHGPGPAARLCFTECRGQLTAELAEPGWLKGLSGESRRAVEVALTGLYALGGVDRVRNGTETPLDAISWERWVESWR